MASYHRSGADDTSRANVGSFENDDTGGDPHPVFNDDGGGLEFFPAESMTVEGMIVIIQCHVGTKGTAVSDGYLLVANHDGISVERHVVTDGDFTAANRGHT